MTWIVGAGLFFFLAFRLRRRSRLVAIAPSDPISTLHVETARKQTKRTRAALDAATAKLW